MKRFEILISSARRTELERLAAELGMSASDLARIGIAWVLAARVPLTSGKMETDG